MITLPFPQAARERIAQPVNLDEARANAAVVLDELWPEWVDTIDVGTLDMHSLDKCIFGQLYGRVPYGSYTKGLERMRGFLGNALYSSSGVGLVFDEGIESASDTEWRKIILARRAAR